MARVKFGMVWSVYGHQEIELPDDVNASNEAEVKKYIQSKWADIPHPEGDYIEGSDVLDEEYVELITE